MSLTLRFGLAATVFAGITGCVPQAATPPDAPRFLVYFDEFSANLTPQALDVLAVTAAKAKEIRARSVDIVARASATGSPTANHYLAQTRAQVVADQLAADGLDRATLRQEPIGQTGSGDTSVAERRVDVILGR